MALFDPEAKDAKVPSAKEPGEFTRLFGTPPELPPEKFGETEPAEDAADNSTTLAPKSTPEIPIASVSAKEEGPVATVLPDTPPPACAAPEGFTVRFGLAAATPAGETLSGEGEYQTPVAASEGSRATPAEVAATKPVKRPPADFTLMSGKAPTDASLGMTCEIVSAPPAKPSEGPNRTPGVFTQLFGAPAQESSEASEPASPTGIPEAMKRVAPAEIASRGSVFAARRCLAPKGSRGREDAG